MSDHDNKCEFMLAPPDMNRLGLCLCKERALKARLATATQLAENTAAGLAATTTRLAEAEREQDTLLAMIRHQRDVLRECLPYLNESMAGRRPGRSADDIRAAVKALTTDSAPAGAAWVDANVSGNPTLMQAMRNFAGEQSDSADEVQK